MTVSFMLFVSIIKSTAHSKNSSLMVDDCRYTFCGW